VKKGAELVAIPFKGGDAGRCDRKEFRRELEWVRVQRGGARGFEIPLFRQDGEVMPVLDTVVVFAVADKEDKFRRSALHCMGNYLKTITGGGVRFISLLESISAALDSSC
jgi:hypothetical protein